MSLTATFAPAAASARAMAAPIAVPGARHMGHLATQVDPIRCLHATSTVPNVLTLDPTKEHSLMDGGSNNLRVRVVDADMALKQADWTSRPQSD